MQIQFLIEYLNPDGSVQSAHVVSLADLSAIQDSPFIPIFDI